MAEFDPSLSLQRRYWLTAVVTTSSVDRPRDAAVCLNTASRDVDKTTVRLGILMGSLSPVLDILANGARTRDRVVRDIHLAHEADARVGLGILYEILEHSHTSGPACNTVVRADRHH